MWLIEIERWSSRDMYSPWGLTWLTEGPMPKPYIIHVANSKLCRVVYSDGRISDLVNESRAKDAVAKLLEEYQHNREIDT